MLVSVGNCRENYRSTSFGYPVIVAPVTSWGTMLSYNITSFLALKTWWTVLPPLTCLTLLGFSLILIGNKVNEILNPETKEHIIF